MEKGNIINIDSIHNSKINSLTNNHLNATHLPNLKKSNINTLKKVNTNEILNQCQQQKYDKQAKDKKNFFGKSASSSVYIPSRKIEERGKNYFKEYRLGLLSAGSTSYNNVIIPMLSMTRHPSGFFDNRENEKSFGNENVLKNRKNYMTYRKKNVVSGGNLKQNRKVRNLSSYSKREDNEEFKDVEKLIPKFHKIKIEKGMMDSKLTKTLKDNFASNYHKNRKYQIKNRLEFMKQFNDKSRIKNIYNEIIKFY